jgi:hypothetical protein
MFIFISKLQGILNENQRMDAQEYILMNYNSKRLAYTFRYFPIISIYQVFPWPFVKVAISQYHLQNLPNPHDFFFIGQLGYDQLYVLLVLELNQQFLHPI